MTPFGHLAVAYLAGKAWKRISIPAILLGGVLPDVDFLFVFFDGFNQIHRVITHNLPFIGIATMAGLLLVPRVSAIPVGAGLFLGGVLHLLVDACMDANPSNGIGVALLWPFYEGFFSPFNLLEPVLAPGWNEPWKQIKAVFPLLVWEIPFYLVVLILFLRKSVPGDRHQIVRSPGSRSRRFGG